MLMLLLQFQITNLTEDERQLIPDFCEWLCTQLYSTIDTKINRRKIQLRMKYLMSVSWIQWNKSKKYETTVLNIMQAIYESFTYVPKKDNIYEIKIDDNILIPNSYTSISRLIRFLNYGDINNKATGIFTKLEQNFDFNKLNSMWRMFMLHELNIISAVKIITK